MSSETEFLNAHERIRHSYKDAMSQVDLAIGHEEHEAQASAIAAYEKALQLIDETFAIPVGLPDDISGVETEWCDACAIIQKLKSAKSEITYRLKVLRSNQSNVDVSAVEAMEAEEEGRNKEQVDGQAAVTTAKKIKPLLADNPVTFYDITNASGTPKTYKQLARNLRELLASSDSNAQFDVLFQALVKLYRIEASGTVTTMTGDSTMSLVLCTVGGKWKCLNGIYFIQCEISAECIADEPSTTSNNGQQNMIWLYPLIPAVTNCYRTDYGAFIFPDVEDSQPGNAFGIMLTKSQRPFSSLEGDESEQMADLQQFFLDLLEAVLAGTVEELKSPHSQRAAARRSGSEQVSQHIVGAADFIARNLVKGAEKTGGLMMKSTPYLISKISAASPDAPPQVPVPVQTTVEVAQKVTHAAAGMTGWIAGKVGTASLAVGRYLAPHIQTQGSRLLQRSLGYNSSDADSTMEGAMTIAAGAVEGITTVFDGLESSAKILGNSLSENSVKIIEHKYGPSAGNLASGTFGTVGNAFVISQNVNYITPKGIAKKMIRKTGEAVVDDYKRDLRESHYITAGNLYPDLRALKQ